MFTSQRPASSCKSPRHLFVTLIALAISLEATNAQSQTTFDFAPRGVQNSFELFDNWIPLGPPGVLDTARFNVNSTYEVLFGSSPTNNELLVSRGNVTFRSLGLINIPVDVTYTLTGEAVIEGSTLAGEQAVMTLTSLFNDTMLLKAEHVGIANSVGTFGRLTVTEPNASLQSDNSLTVGGFGTGELVIENGGSVSNAAGGNPFGSSGSIGGEAGSTGTVTVRNAGSTWTTSEGLFTIGNAGAGTLTIEDGGNVSQIVTELGILSGSTGTVMVTGAGSTWTASNLTIGVEGAGMLTIENGGSVSSGGNSLGFGTGSTGMATITGVGSTWMNSGDLTIGDHGAGTLTIENGGSVSSRSAEIASSSDSTGTVTVTGAGSMWV